MTRITGDTRHYMVDRSIPYLVLTGPGVSKFSPHVSHRPVSGLAWIARPGRMRLGGLHRSSPFPCGTTLGICVSEIG
jgi:hypothetical protein